MPKTANKKWHAMQFLVSLRDTNILIPGRVHLPSSLASLVYRCTIERFVSGLQQIGANRRHLMAKKRSKKVNKSAEIRAYLAAHPNVKLADAAEALTKKGINVNAQYISVVKSAAKKSTARKKSPAKKPKSVSRNTASSERLSFEAVAKARSLRKSLRVLTKRSALSKR